MPGQFASDASGTGRGVQEIFTKIQATQGWSASDDWDRPDIRTVAGTITGSTATFRTCSSATDVTRGVVLFLPTEGPSVQAWTHVELVEATGGCWVGTRDAGRGRSRRSGSSS